MREEKESDIEKAFVATVKKMGARCLKLSFQGTDGAYDRLLLMRGYHCFIEFKRSPKHKLSPQQRLIGKQLRAAGCNTAVIDCIQDAKQFIAALVILDKTVRS